MSAGGMKLKFLAEIVAGQSPASEDVSGLLDGKPFLQGNAEFGSETPYPKLQCDSATKSARPGDVLLSVRAPVGALNLADRAYGIGRGLCAVRPRAGDSRFYFWWLHTRKAELHSLATGSTFLAVTAGTVGNLTVEVVDSEEQRAIASFLDYETAEIDAFIADQQELIGLLNERRAATITQAVTKGLDPNVPMKDRGVEWLGTSPIPAHWEARKLGQVARMQSGNSITAESIEIEGTYPVYGGGGFRGYTETYTNEGVHVLIGRQGALCGNIKRAEGKFFATEHAIVSYPRLEVDIAWFASVLQVMDLGRYSQSAAQPGLSVDVIAQKKLPVPPYQEQVQIGIFITTETAEIDAAIGEAKESIELSKERRAALISAAVTGKIDVRDHPAAKGAA